MCPSLMFQHVATWREGDDKWAYRSDSADGVATQKVSLDPYRAKSREILACIKAHSHPAPLQRVEKASVDEVFLDLSAQVHSILLERYSEELARPPPYDDPTENLPLPPTTVLDWQADALVDLDTGETELDDPDWDDIAMLIGSEIVRSLRAAVREELKFTCSAGIARNKMVAKLGAGANKPNQQTVVRNRAIQQFLDGYKFTKIRNLGGKLGEQVVNAFKKDMVRDLLEVSSEEMKSKLGDDTAAYVYKLIRGEDTSEVNSRTQIKSMLSAKSFRPSIDSEEQGHRWLRIFVADIYNRLIDDGILENKRRPRTITLHHRQSGTTRSRQLPIPTGKKIDVNLLFELAKTLLSQVIIDGRAWPCGNLSLSVGGFEEGTAGNRTLGGFVLTGEAAKTARDSTLRLEMPSPAEDLRPEKRRRVGDGGIQKFFNKRESSREEHEDDFDADGTAIAELQPASANPEYVVATRPASQHAWDLDAKHESNEETAFPEDVSDTYICPKCQASVSAWDQAEHEDWHLAKELQAEERSSNRSSSNVGTSTMSKKPKAIKPQRGPRKPGGEAREERGQMKLVFGK